MPVKAFYIIHIMHSPTNAAVSSSAVAAAPFQTGMKDYKVIT